MVEHQAEKRNAFFAPYNALETLQNVQWYIIFTFLFAWLYGLASPLKNDIMFWLALVLQARLCCSAIFYFAVCPVNRSILRFTGFFDIGDAPALAFCLRGSTGLLAPLKSTLHLGLNFSAFHCSPNRAFLLGDENGMRVCFDFCWVNFQTVVLFSNFVELNFKTVVLFSNFGESIFKSAVLFVNQKLILLI